MANGIIPKRTLEEIRFRNDIVDVVGSYLNLKKSGSAFKTTCPFHKEKTPSFHVNPQRQIYHCFGCGAGGDVFGFIMAYEGVDFTTSARMLAERSGITLEFEKGAAGKGAEKDVLYRLHGEVADLFHRGLLKSPRAAEARAELERRKLSGDIAEEFLIGYAPPSWDTIYKWALGKKYRMEQIVAAGLAVKSTKPGSDQNYYDRFRNRLMFPVHDELGRVVAFSGRILGSDDKGAKYVNSPDTLLFRKGRILYALSKARRAITETRTAIICEGQIDVIRCHQAGIKNAVAAQGTAFTEDHARILKRYSDEVTIVFDTDVAGENAAVKAARIFLQVGLAVRIASLPKDEDPDSYILKEGPDAFRKAVEAARPVVHFQIDAASKHEDHSTEVGLMRIARSTLETIMQSPSAVQRAKLVQMTAERLGLPVNALQEEFKQMQRRTRRPFEKKPDQTKQKSRPREEEALAEHVVANPATGELVLEYLPMAMFTDNDCRVVVNSAIEAAATEKELIGVVATHCENDPETCKFAVAVQMAPAKATGKEYSDDDAVKDIILYMWRKELKRKRTDLEQKLIAGSDDIELRTESIQLRNDIKQLSMWDTGVPIIEIRMEGQGAEDGERKTDVSLPALPELVLGPAGEPTRPHVGQGGQEEAEDEFVDEGVEEVIGEDGEPMQEIIEPD